MCRRTFLLLTAGWLVLASQLPLSASDPKQVAADEQRLKAVGIKTDDADLLAFLRSRTLTRVPPLQATLLMPRFSVFEHVAKQPRISLRAIRATRAIRHLGRPIRPPCRRIARR